MKKVSSWSIASDFIDSEDELEKAAYQYVLNSRDGGEMHVRKGVSTMVESVVLTKESAARYPRGHRPDRLVDWLRVNDDRGQVKKGITSVLSSRHRHRQKKVLAEGEYTKVGKAMIAAAAVAIAPRSHCRGACST